MPPNVLGVIEIELADQVDPDEFERFALQEYLPTVASLGMACRLLRGNRGERDTQYLLIEEFTSIDHRNSLFPGSETPSLAVARWIEANQQVVKRWNAMIASARTTHYEVRGIFA
jgi:hypothetical protein